MANEVAMTAFSCSLCVGGEGISLPERPVELEGYEFIQDCRGLASFVPFLDVDSEECELVQSISSICGCPKRDDACHLCPDGSSVQFPDRELGFLSDMFGGVTPTCELVEAGLHSYSLEDSTCLNTQIFLSNYCGCGVDPTSIPFTPVEECSICLGGEPVVADKELGLDGFPVQTCGQLDEASRLLFQALDYGNLPEITTNPCWGVRLMSNHCGCDQIHADPCPICRESGKFEVSVPDKIVGASNNIGEFLQILTTGLDTGDITCGLLASITATFPLSVSREDWWGTGTREWETGCKLLQGIGTSECECPGAPEKDYCFFCSSGEIDPSLADKVIVDEGPWAGATCSHFETTFQFIEPGDMLPIKDNLEGLATNCRTQPFLGALCGCNDGVVSYWGADTVSKQRTAVFMQAVSAILSFVGSISILTDILRNRGTKKGTYYSLMLGLCLFDLLSSIAWGLGPLPTNIDAESIGIDTDMFIDEIQKVRFYGSVGSEASCRIQGFLLHLGFSSILYNLALAYFFKLSIVNGWREASFTVRYKLLLIMVPGLFGFCIAFAAIPSITSTPIACTIGTPYDSDYGWLKVLFLFYIPYGPAFLLTPVILALTYRQARAKFINSSRGATVQASSNREMERRDATSPSNRIHEVSRQVNTRELDVEGEQGTLDQRKLFSNLWIRNQRDKPAENVVSSAIAKLENQVLWQAIWYGSAFLASYAIFFSLFTVDGYTSDMYGLYILSAILTPLQGFFNALVYFRRRISLRSLWSCLVVEVASRVCRACSVFVSCTKRMMFSSCGGGTEAGNGGDLPLSSDWMYNLRSTYFVNPAVLAHDQSQPLDMLNAARNSTGTDVHFQTSVAMSGGRVEVEQDDDGAQSKLNARINDARNNDTSSLEVNTTTSNTRYASGSEESGSKLGGSEVDENVLLSPAVLDFVPVKFRGGAESIRSENKTCVARGHEGTKLSSVTNCEPEDVAPDPNISSVLVNGVSRSQNDSRLSSSECE